MKKLQVSQAAKTLAAYRWQGRPKAAKVAQGRLMAAARWAAATQARLAAEAAREQSLKEVNLCQK